MISFKYREDVPEHARDEHRQKLASLAGIDGVLELKVGADIVHAARSFDTGLLVRFRDRAALDAYQKHPQHVPIAQLGASLAGRVVAVDFEA